MDIGNYLNIFGVNFNKTEFELHDVARSQYPIMKELRSKTNAILYPYRDRVYALSDDSSEITKLGFVPAKVTISDHPGIICFLITTAFGEKAKKLGFELGYGFSNSAFDKQNKVQLSLNEVSLFNGFEYRAIFLKEKAANQLFFGLIVDQKFRLELQNSPTSYHKIQAYVSNNYDWQKAKDIVKEIRIKTGDYTPSGARNTESSRVRCDNIIAFMKKIDILDMFDGSKATISSEPTRIVLEA